jgi:hypothetical protein
LVTQFRVIIGMNYWTLTLFMNAKIFAGHELARGISFQFAAPILLVPIILWHADTLLGNGRIISNCTTAIAR